MARLKGTTAAWLAFIAATTYRWEHQNKGTLPQPQVYFGGAVIYSMLGLLAMPAPQLAAALGWAFVVGALSTGTLLPGDGPGAGRPSTGAGGTPRHPTHVNAGGYTHGTI